MCEHPAAIIEYRITPRVLAMSENEEDVRYMCRSSAQLEWGEPLFLKGLLKLGEGDDDDRF